MKSQCRFSIHSRHRFNVIASFVSGKLYSILLLLMVWEMCSAVRGQLPAAVFADDIILQYSSQGLQALPQSQQALKLSHTFLSAKEGPIAGDRVRRRLTGPGSAPPNCVSKCGKCLPCKPVRVPIQPGKSARLTEYYPEAWRCQCGKKLFMP